MNAVPCRGGCWGVTIPMHTHLAFLISRFVVVVVSTAAPIPSPQNVCMRALILQPRIPFDPLMTTVAIDKYTVVLLVWKLQLYGTGGT